MGFLHHGVDRFLCLAFIGAQILAVDDPGLRTGLPPGELISGTERPANLVVL